MRETTSYHVIKICDLRELSDENRIEEIKDRLYGKKFSTLISPDHFKEHKVEDREIGPHSLEDLKEKVLSWATDKKDCYEHVFVEVENDNITAFFQRGNNTRIDDLRPKIEKEFEIVGNSNTFFKSSNEIWLDKLSELCKTAPIYLNRKPDSIARIQHVLDSWENNEEKIKTLRKMKLSNTQDENLKDMYKAFKKDDSEGFDKANEKMVERKAENNFQL